MAQENACCKGARYFPGRFEGKPHQKALVHWLQFKDYTQFHNITDANAIKEFIFTLGDEARIWYEENAEAFTDITVLERKFKSTYGRATTREEHLNAFAELTYTPGEPLNAYRNRVRSTAARAKITDQEHVRLQFINGFPSHIRSALRAKRDNTLDDCMLTAQALMSEAPLPSAPAMAIMPNDKNQELVNQLEALFFSTNQDRQPRQKFRQYDKDRRFDRSQSRSSSTQRGRSQSRDRYRSDRKTSHDSRYNNYDN